MIEALIALLALSLMEIVLGIDNIVFISVATGKLPAKEQSSARRLGLLVALGTRILLLCGIYWMAQLVNPVFTISNLVPPVENLKPYFVVPETYEERLNHSMNTHGVASEGGAATQKAERAFDQNAWDEFDHVSWRDLILMAGGLFLIYSSVREIHTEVETDHTGLHPGVVPKAVSYTKVLVQVAIMDIIFSLDSVITAVGMANQLWVMITAVILAVGVMILFADQVGNFVDQNPTVKMLALAFLLLIGVMLVAEGIGTPISKGYIYFAMGFSLLVEVFNMQVRKRRLETKTLPANESVSQSV